MEEVKKRNRRSKEERVAEIDKKIETYENNIKSMTQKIKLLKQQKQDILNPKITVREIISMAKANGLTEEDIAKKLGIKI